MQKQGFILQNYVLFLCNYWTNTTYFDSIIGKFLVQRKDALCFLCHFFKKKKKNRITKMYVSLGQIFYLYF